MKISGDFIHLVETEGYWKPKHLLKGPVQRLPHSQAPAEGWKKDSGFEGARDIQGVTKLGGFKVRARGTITTVPVLIPLLLQLVGKLHLSCVEPFPNIHKYESTLAW